MTIAEWDPSTVDRPANAVLTPYRDGWCRHINGMTRHVCGRIPYRQAEKRYLERVREGHFDLKPVKRIEPGTLTVSDLVNLYRAWLVKRLETGRPKKLSRRTFHDIRGALVAFKDAVRATKIAAELGPEEGTKFLHAIPGKSPYVQARFVAYVSSMIRWAVKAEHLPHIPNLGPDFVKPSASALKAATGGKVSAWTPDEVRKMVEHARATENRMMLAWVYLGVNCGFRNDDVGGLTRDAVKLDRGIIDFRRPKTDEARWCPLRPETAAALKAYDRPTTTDAEYDDRFFLTQRGKPWVRFNIKRSSTGAIVAATPIYVGAAKFAGFLEEAGIESKGRGMGAFRHLFRSIADAQTDERAADTIMGHKSRSLSHISSAYAGKPDEKRLRSVVDHVWGEVFTRRARSRGKNA